MYSDKETQDQQILLLTYSCIFNITAVVMLIIGLRHDGSLGYDFVLNSLMLVGFIFPLILHAYIVRMTGGVLRWVLAILNVCVIIVAAIAIAFGEYIAGKLGLPMTYYGQDYGRYVGLCVDVYAVTSNCAMTALSFIRCVVTRRAVYREK